MFPPFDRIFFPPSSPKLFLERSYFRLSIPAQHRRSRRRYVASHTAPFTLSLHSIHPKNFCRGSPQKQVSTRSKIHSLREKTLQHAATSFRRHTTYKNCRTVKFRTHQLTTRGRSTQQTIRENLSQTTRPAVTQSQTSTNKHSKQPASVFSTTSMSARNHCQHHMQSKITCEKRSQRAHSKLLARSSRKIATSAKVRDSSTGKEIAGGSGSDLGVFHHGMITAANKRNMILHSNVLSQIRSSTVPGRVASCSRLPIVGTLDG